jgi:DNA helicase HerA-like ATPase
VNEAHDVCPAEPAEPAEPLQRLAVDFTRVAGQGRKYGIHLLLAAQRPDKLPTNVLSQCDNLLLMRVNSAGDGPALASMLPLQLVELAGTFELEESLLAGKVSPDPQLTRTGARLTRRAAPTFPRTGRSRPTPLARADPGSRPL